MAIDSTVLVALVGFMTTITVTVLQQLAESRKAQHDRNLKARQIRSQLKRHSAKSEHAVGQAEQAVHDTKSHVEAVEQKLHHIENAVAENTTLTVKAIEEANHVNEKIRLTQEELRPALKEIAKVLPPIAEALQQAALGDGQKEEHHTD